MSVFIRFEGPTSVEPNSEVRGHVEWTAGERPPESLMISLLWHTEGKGTEDIEIVEQIEFADPSGSGRHEFAFRLPEFPWSFSGTLLALVWAVEASLEPGGFVERVNLVSAPGAEEVRI